MPNSRSKVRFASKHFQVRRLFILQIREETKKGVHMDIIGIEVESQVEVVGKVVITTIKIKGARPSNAEEKRKKDK